MKYHFIRIILLLSVQVAYTTAATETEEDHTTSYLSPDQVSRDKYDVILDFKMNYDQCIIDTARAALINYNDPRHVLDIALKRCADQLNELNQWLIEERFPPNFRKAQLTKISRQSVRKTIPEIMFLMSTKSAAQSEPNL